MFRLLRSVCLGIPTAAKKINFLAIFSNSLNNKRNKGTLNKKTRKIITNSTLT